MLKRQRNRSRLEIRFLQCLEVTPSQVGFPGARLAARLETRVKRGGKWTREAVFLLLRRPEKLEAEDQETLALLRSLHPEVDQAYELVQQFTQMLRERLGERLDSWLGKAEPNQKKRVLIGQIS